MKLQIITNNFTFRQFNNCEDYHIKIETSNVILLQALPTSLSKTKCIVNSTSVFLRQQQQEAGKFKLQLNKDTSQITEKGREAPKQRELSLESNLSRHLCCVTQ